MKILLISHTYMPKINQRKLDVLSNLPNVQLRVIVPQRWNEPNRFSLRAEIPEGESYEYCPLPTWFAPEISRYLYRSLDLTMRDFQPDVVHFEESARCLSLFQTLVYKRLWASQARLVFFAWANIYVPLRPRFLSFFERYNLSHSDWAIVGNSDAGEVLRQRGFGRPVSVIPQLGVDLDLFKPGDGSSLRQRLGLPRETFVIGFASRMVAEKGVQLLVEGASRLDGDWALLLIGQGPAREEVLRRAQQLGVCERLRLVDNVPHLEFVHYLRAMDVLVLPCVSTPIWKEQYAGGLLQAMACKIPAVGSTCGEIPNVVGDAGLIFPEGDVSALIRCLRDLQTQPRLRTVLIQRGSDRVRQYTWEALAQQTYVVWERLLSAGSSKCANNVKSCAIH